MDVTAAPFVGLDPDGEELRGEVAGAGRFQVEHSGTERAGEVPGLVDEALGCVSVAVDDERLGVEEGGIGHVVDSLRSGCEFDVEPVCIAAAARLDCNNRRRGYGRPDNAVRNPAICYE